MAHINIEIKAKSNNQDTIREILKSKNADFKGVDHQIDTYFKVDNGRLKLRQGKIENYLIYYQRENKEGPKQSDVILFKSDPEPSLKEILTKALGILVIVDKKREIYFIDNVKFHLDTVKNLGKFVEIEAIDNEGTIGKDKLLEQCQFFLDLFEISKEDLISVSYSDLLLQK
jgi:adenylate cyclase, class 2